MSVFTLDDIKWAAEECERQRSGEMSVYRLAQALDLIRDRKGRNKRPSLEDISHLGHIVEPEKNRRPHPATQLWRTVRVTIGGVVPLPNPEHLDRLMENLHIAWGDLSADEWYREFEEIHPFVDGNGRVGSILWNLKRGSIMNPKAPPDFWSEENKRRATAHQWLEYERVAGRYGSSEA